MHGLHELPSLVELHLRLPVRHCKQAVLIFIVRFNIGIVSTCNYSAVEKDELILT